MNIAEIRGLIDSALARGLLIRTEGTMLSSSEGYNYAGRAVLGALLDNAGQAGFNAYCANQKSMLGWLSSKGNPLTQRARSILKASGSDPSMRSIFTDVEREFIRPLVDEHTRQGGRRPSSAEIDATCAMLAAKILWDLQMGNGDLSRSVKMLAASVPTGDASVPTSGSTDDGYQSVGASGSHANVANEMAYQIYEASLRGAVYLTTTSMVADPRAVVLVCRELQNFLTYVLTYIVIRERNGHEGGRLCAMLGSFGTEYLRRIAEQAVGTSLPEELNAEEFQKAFEVYYASQEETPESALASRVARHLGSDRSDSIVNLISHVLQRGNLIGFQEAGIPTIDVARLISNYLAA